MLTWSAWNITLFLREHYFTSSFSIMKSISVIFISDTFLKIPVCQPRTPTIPCEKGHFVNRQWTSSLLSFCRHEVFALAWRQRLDVNRRLWILSVIQSPLHSFVNASELFKNADLSFEPFALKFSNFHLFVRQLTVFSYYFKASFMLYQSLIHSEPFWLYYWLLSVKWMELDSRWGEIVCDVTGSYRVSLKGFKGFCY